MLGMFDCEGFGSSFNIDLSSWNIAKVTTVQHMFYGAIAYNHNLCGVTWIESSATGKSNARVYGNMFGSTTYEAGTSAKIGSEICSCVQGKFLTPGSPKTCHECSQGRYQDERGFNGSSCKECQDGYMSNVDKSGCLVEGSDP